VNFNRDLLSLLKLASVQVFPKLTQDYERTICFLDLALSTAQMRVVYPELAVNQNKMIMWLLWKDENKQPRYMLNAWRLGRHDDSFEALLKSYMNAVTDELDDEKKRNVKKIVTRLDC